MFKPTRVCWGELQKSLAKYSDDKKNKYVVKIDVANFFGSLNQHTLINVLSDAGYPNKYSTRLDAVLTAYTGDRSSRGIIQGIYPSDLLGNFYMEPIDRFLADQNIPSARYVDDMYIFLGSVDAAERLMRQLIPELRSYDLVLNEAKSVIMPKNALNTEEPDLEALFEEAVEEISNQIDDEDFDADYGFQSEWEEDDHDEEEENNDTGKDDDDLELKATKFLFDAIADHPGHEETIERFCLPLFAKASSDYAVDHVFDAFKKRPSMTQIYVSYLSKILPDGQIYSFLCQSLDDQALNDWQIM
ncbi:MAG: RNA-directed DNA polymerase [Hoeflea sp.]|nr:RNA-directed DNA polymerase [Hoeflea sp.]